MKILILDNYDSFTYNLVHLLEKLGDNEIQVHRNDKISLKEIDCFDKIVLSPGPGVPANAGLLLDVIKEYAGKKSILGVCLGHQGIAEAFGGKLMKLKNVLHGVALPVMTRGEDKLFKSIPECFLTARYHSWVVSPENFPSCLKITAVDEMDNIMAIRHKVYDIAGVQFHPESIMTQYGEELMCNWLKG